MEIENDKLVRQCTKLTLQNLELEDKWRTTKEFKVQLQNVKLAYPIVGEEDTIIYQVSHKIQE